MKTTKKLAVLGWIYRSGMITEEEYMKAKRIIISNKKPYIR